MTHLGVALRGLEPVKILKTSFWEGATGTGPRPPLKNRLRQSLKLSLKEWLNPREEPSLSDDRARTYDQTSSLFKDYSREARFLEEVVRRWRPGARSLLDVACGTGAHLLDLARLGFDCTGLDLNPAVLEVARAKFQQQGLPVRLVTGDMRDFRLERPVDVAVNMFYSFHNVLYQEEEQLSCLRCIHRALKPLGLLILEILPEDTNLRLYPPGRVFEISQIPQEDGSVLRVFSENRLVSPEMKEVIFTFQTLRDGQVVRTKQVVSPFRRLYSQDLERLLALTGFRILERFGDCDLEVPFTAVSKKLVVVTEALTV